MQPTNPETDPSEAALAAFISACYAQEAAARRYCEAEIESTREHFREFCGEQDADADLTDLVHEFADGLETVIYTHRARALVMGYGESEARHEYGQEIGWSDGADPGGSWGVLAFFILERECSEIAYELEEEREEQEAAR
jgi:hypothetical protein